MKPRTAIQKGKDLENYVSDQIKDYNLASARRSAGSGSGNREKADIDTDLMILGQNAGIECKNYKNAHIQDWWKQTLKLEQLGREPVLVYKLGQESMGDAKAVIYLDTLLRLIKQGKEPKTPDNGGKELTWALKTLVQACKKVIKLLE